VTPRHDSLSVRAREARAIVAAWLAEEAKGDITPGDH
jgi:hypothetical protein